MSRQLIRPPGAPQPVSYYSHGIRVGAVLYSAGQTARDATGQLVGLGNVRQQAEQAFYNLSLVLNEARMGFQQVVRLNIFVRRTHDLPEIFEVKARYFKENRPALTVAAVASLAYAEYLLEIEAIAVEHR
jgi:2-iminobutanoate/2-iminopropanoate deaminase